jgi:hypothetical protein
VTLVGFAIALLSLILHSVGAQLVVILLGISVSLYGITGVLHKHDLKNAIWKKR